MKMSDLAPSISIQLICLCPLFYCVVSFVIQIVMQAINKNYRRIPIPRELLAWTEYDVNNIDAIQTFFSQFTITLLRISSPEDRAAKNVAEFMYA